jgi:glutamate-1-semialdehyde 2,1-aminomutase
MAESTMDLQAYRQPQTASPRLHPRALRVMPGGNTRTTVHLDPYPPYAVRGSGATIVDAEGEERTDFLNNYTSLIHGHADPDVVAAVTEQAQSGTAFGLPTPSEIDLAELLVERVPSIEQIRFANSGTEAVMIALQAARAFTGRPKIAKFEGSYHGFYDFAAVSTAIRPGSEPSTRPESLPHAPGSPDAVADNVVVLRYNDLDSLEQGIEANKDQLAAVLIDLMPWRMGLIAAEESFVSRLRQLTHAHGILLIADEIITFRLAAGGAQSMYAVQPDLTTLGKIIGGGFPVGAVGGRAEVMAVFDPRSGGARVSHGGTFTANPITMAAGLATMRKLTPDAYTRLNAQGDSLRQGLTDAIGTAGIPGQVTGAGSLFGLSVADAPVRDYRSWLGSERERTWRSRIYSTLLARGSLVAPHLVGCLSTPMRQTDLDTLVDDVGRALEGLKRDSALR